MRREGRDFFWSVLGRMIDHKGRKSTKRHRLFRQPEKVGDFWSVLVKKSMPLGRFLTLAGFGRAMFWSVWQRLPIFGRISITTDIFGRFWAKTAKTRLKWPIWPFGSKNEPKPAKMIKNWSIFDHLGGQLVDLKKWPKPPKTSLRRSLFWRFLIKISTLKFWSKTVKKGNAAGWFLAVFSADFFASFWREAKIGRFWSVLALYA